MKFTATLREENIFRLKISYRMKAGAKEKSKLRPEKLISCQTGAKETAERSLAATVGVSNSTRGLQW